MTESLCTACSRFTQDFGKVEQNHRRSTFEVAPNICSLRKLAQNGCPLCQMIYQSCFYNERVSWLPWIQASPIRVVAWAKRRAIQESSDSDSDSDSDSESDSDEVDDVLPSHDQNSGYLELLVGLGGEMPRGVWHDIPLVINESMEEPVNAPRPHSTRPIMDLCSAQGLEDAVALAKKWMLNCSTSHTKCNQTLDTEKSTKILPTRLIDVGSTDGETIPKISVPEKRAQDMEYVALSYAWGSNPDFAKTTASNIDEMMKFLPWNKLAKTVQDAIIFTRKLGIKYLWVDALCILQSGGPDDVRHRADWSHEAARFGQYYQNARLTIAATGAKSSDEGLFLPRPALEFDPKPVAFRLSTLSEKIKQVTIPPLTPLWEPGIRTAALLFRGWAIQERVMSKRILHFGINCVFWECHECRTTETDPDRSDPKAYSYTGEDFISAFRDLQSHQEEAIIQSWYRFVEVYSTRDFSFHSDKLPALSGIAARVQNRILQRYIAGTWESTIPEGLTWWTCGTFDLTSKSLHSEPIIPSWCWASCRGTICFFFTCYEDNDWTPMIQIKSCSVETNGPNTSGQILQARLQVSGRFKIMDLSDLKFIFLHDSKSTAEQWDDVSNDDLEDLGAPFHRRAFIDDARHVRRIRNHPHPCLLIGTITVHAWNPPGRMAVGAALILESTGRRVGMVEEYKRLGLVCLSFEEYWSGVGDVRTVELV